MTLSQMEKLLLSVKLRRPRTFHFLIFFEFFWTMNYHIFEQFAFMDQNENYCEFWVIWMNVESVFTWR